MKHGRWTYRVAVLLAMVFVSGAAIVVIPIPVDLLPVLALLFVILLTIWIVVVDRFLRPLLQGMKEAEAEYRLRTGRCLNCGYSLRGNESGVCPECGAVKTN